MGGKSRRGCLDGMSGNGGGEQHRRGVDALAGKVLAQFFQGTLHAHASRIFSQTQGITNFAMTFLLKKAQHHGLAVPVAELAHGVVEHGSKLLPRNFRRRQDLLHNRSLLFACAPTVLADGGIAGGITCAGMEPATKGWPMAEQMRLAGQIRKYPLGHILGLLGVATGQPPRHRVNHVHVPTDNFGKRRLVTVAGIPAQ